VAADPQVQQEAAQHGAWARPISARGGEVFVAVVLLGIGAFFMAFSLPLQFGRVGLPGPGFFPFVLGIGLGICALGLLYRALRETIDVEAVFIGHRDVLIALAAMAGLAAAFEQADSYLVLGLFSAALLILIARAALWRVALGAVFGMVVVWAFFGLALGVRLPVGDFWRQATDVVAKLSASLF
jgi:hypothetical protein